MRPSTSISATAETRTVFAERADEVRPETDVPGEVQQGHHGGKERARQHEERESVRIVAADIDGEGRKAEEEERGGRDRDRTPGDRRRDPKAKRRQHDAEGVEDRCREGGQNQKDVHGMLPAASPRDPSGWGGAGQRKSEGRTPRGPPWRRPVRHPAAPGSS